ncbi:MAG: hypothetical protein ACRESZ_02075 [Methylococcales bacterium]
MDISYINIAGTFYYLSAILDGYSRYLVHREIRERMLNAGTGYRDYPAAGQGALSGACPRIISDNGPQFIAKDFKEYIRLRQV